MLATQKIVRYARPCAPRFRERVPNFATRARDRSDGPARRSHGDRRAGFRYAGATSRRAAVDALLAHDTHYTPSQGTLELREVVAEYASRFRKMATPYTAANVTISPGAKPIIWNIL